MAEQSIPAWSLSGDYFENCNCAIACPCLFTDTPLATAPTEGACEVAFAFHVDRGSYGDVPLAGLNVAMIARTPGPMAEGNWTVALYLDERADERQQAALGAIFGGQAGGVMGGFAPLIGQVLGAKAVPIRWTKEGNRRAVEIPGIMDAKVRATGSLFGPDAEVMVANAHPFNQQGIALAIGEEGSVWSDYGMRWDNSGRNGHYAPINWSNG